MKVDWALGSNWIKSYQPAIKPPAGLSSQEKFKWYQEWTQSEAGKVYVRGQRVYAVKIRPDGSFQVDDVPAGSYRLVAEVGGTTMWGMKVAVPAQQETVVVDLTDSNAAVPKDFSPSE